MGLHGDHDDYGLPKVDIVVPDDARELDRDVIAYRRELRQQRRRARWRRLGRPFTRYGIAAPFIASAVLVALISGVLMTVISPRPGPRSVQVPPNGPQRLRPGDVGSGLPTGSVIFRHRRVPVTQLVNVAGVVLVVPRQCECDAAAQNLIRQASGQRLQVWPQHAPIRHKRPERPLHLEQVFRSIRHFQTPQARIQERASAATPRRARPTNTCFLIT